MDRQPSFLEHLGASHAGFLHARGEAATELLMEELALTAGDRVLDLGCGTGASLTAMASRYPQVDCTGADTSPLMLSAARRRLNVCGLGGRVSLVRLQPGAPLPFADGAFTKLSCESVLAIQETATIRDLVSEICRVLAPGGLACINETVWTTLTPAGEMARVNTLCRKLFGMVQSNAEVPRAEDWSSLFAAYPLSLTRLIKLDDAPPLPRRRMTRAERISRIYTLAGTIRIRLSPEAWRRERRFERGMRELRLEKNALEGLLFVLRRDSEDRRI